MFSVSRVTSVLRLCALGYRTGKTFRVIVVWSLSHGSVESENIVVWSLFDQNDQEILACAIADITSRRREYHKHNVKNS